MISTNAEWGIKTLYSIIIPMYNLEEYIQGTLESILKNDLDECELILLDDGSDDKTVEVAEAILNEKCPCRYIIIKKENTGVSDTRNKGINVANGRYIIFCDGDDFVEHDMIETVKNELCHEYDMIVWPFYIMQGREKRISQKGKENIICSAEQMMELHLLEGYKIRLGSFAIRKDLLVDNDIFFSTNCTFAEDMEFIMKSIMNSQSIRCISRPLYCYVKREGSLVNSYNIRRFEAPRAIERVYEYLLNNDISMQEIVKEYIQNGLYLLHYMYSLEGCIANLDSLKQGYRLFVEITKNYADVKKCVKVKIKKMNKFPVGMSEKRVKLLKLGTFAYIQVRIITKRMKER